MKKKLAGTIDCTPTWRGVALTLALAAAEGGSDARKELLRMAALADAFKELQPLLQRCEDVLKWEQVEGYPALLRDIANAVSQHAPKSQPTPPHN